MSKNPFDNGVPATVRLSYISTRITASEILVSENPPVAKDCNRYPHCSVGISGGRIGRATRDDTGLLGVEQGTPATGIAEIPCNGSDDAGRVADALAARDIDFGTVEAVHLFAPDSPADETTGLTVQAPVICMICVPGARMLPHEQNPPTDAIARAIGPACPNLAEPRAIVRYVVHQAPTGRPKFRGDTTWASSTRST
ncbi:MAG: hypothetical protein QF896_07730 [Acidimicrobiales bacterium]|nr:hypothetical protein [Acidimicrobiales bacterium]